MGRSADLPRESGQTDGDDSGCPILHVDMDAFYASVEIRRRPELRGKPVIVGGGQRGVVSAASYEARRYGVRSAQPMSVALRNCPRAVVITPDHKAYSEVSRAVMTIFRSVTPLVEPLSLDEAFLDVSGARTLLGRPAEIAQRIRAQVFAEQQLTCSVGVAPSKFVAKVASARCKPDGMLVVPADEVLDFLHPLPITALWGVGPSTAERLRRLGLRTVADVAATPLDMLTRAVGTGSAEHLSRLAAGLDPRSVQTVHVDKSISCDNTFTTDLTELADIERELHRMADELARRVRSRGLAGRTIGIKVRFADFRTISRTRTLPDPTDSGPGIHAAALELYRSLGLDRPRIRLLGVKAESLSAAGSSAHQLSFEEMLTTPDRPAVKPTSIERQRAASAGSAGERDRSGAEGSATAAVEAPGQPPRKQPSTLDEIADAARTRFGAAALRPASLLGPSRRDG